MRTHSDKPLEGFAALKIWNPTYRHHHLPRWFIARLRTTVTAHQWRHLHAENFMPSAIFDHWGSIANPIGGNDRWITAQPYGCDTATAQAFADKLGILLVSVVTPGPWHHWTTLYTFAPKP
jgi:hypothetical protein